MRIRLRHATTYDYDEPAAEVIQALKVAPRPHEGQEVRSWRVDVDVDGLLRQSRDAFGNIQHLFYAEAPVQQVTVRVTGEAEVRDTAGVVRGAPEPLPPAAFLRETPLSSPDDEMRDWALSLPDGDPLSRLHALMEALHGRMQFDTDATVVGTSGAKAFAARHGVCQDYAHIFVAAARLLGLPARYVSGHLARCDADEKEAAHAWAEAYVGDLGWTAFDPANAICADGRYLRVAVGLDYLDAAPLRGARRGGGEERMSVTVLAREAMRQRQE
jgi:transglutaminase-like putative cysteine protease